MFEIKDTLVHLAYREAKLFVRLALHCGLLRLQGNYEKTTSNDTPPPEMAVTWTDVAMCM